MWGVLTALNDILIPHLKNLFSLNYFQVMLVQFSFFSAYALLSIPMGQLIVHIGYQKGLVVGFILTGISCLSLILAAIVIRYPVFLIGLIILGAGITLLQVTVNSYVSLLGRKENATSRLTFAQAMNSLGTTIAPIFGSIFILKATIHQSPTLAIKHAYALLAITVFILVIIYTIVPLTRINPTTLNHQSRSLNRSTGYRQTLKYKHLSLGCLAIFLYVGAEVAIGSFLINYLSQPNIMGLSADQAAYYVSFYWGGAMVGRFIGSYLLKKMYPPSLLALNAVCASILVLISILSTHLLAMWSITAVGLFNSIMFPTIFALAHRELKENSTYASALLCTSIVGGAIIPIIQGYIADQIGIHLAFFIPILCYFYIFYYGIKGYNKKIPI